MAGTLVGHEVCAGKDISRVTIDGDLLDAINALPDKRSWSEGYHWTPEKDAALLAGWGRKPANLICKVIGCGEKTARKRYRELINGKQNN